MQTSPRSPPCQRRTHHRPRHRRHHAASSRAGRSAARRFAVEHPVAAYLVLSFGIAWPVLFTLVLLRQPVEPGLLVLVVPRPDRAGRADHARRRAVGRRYASCWPGRSAGACTPAGTCWPCSACRCSCCWRRSVARGAAPAQALLQDPGIVTAYLMALLIVPLINLWEETGWMFVQTRLEHRRRGARRRDHRPAVRRAARAALPGPRLARRDTALASCCRSRSRRSSGSWPGGSTGPHAPAC